MCHRSDGDVIGLALNSPAIAVSHPTQLGQEEAAVGFIDLELLGIRIAKALTVSLALEAREAHSSAS